MLPLITGWEKRGICQAHQIHLFAVSLLDPQSPMVYTWVHKPWPQSGPPSCLCVHMTCCFSGTQPQPSLCINYPWLLCVRTTELSRCEIKAPAKTKTLSGILCFSCLLYFYIFRMCVHIWTCEHMHAHPCSSVRLSQKTTCSNWFSLCIMWVLGNETQIFRLGSRRLCLLRYLTSSTTLVHDRVSGSLSWSWTLYVAKDNHDF